MMNDLTPLTRPAQSQVKIDSVAKECPSDGFNYPTFRQLNKHARLYLSQPLQLNTSASYNLFDAANSKGWFVAVKQASTGSDLIFSTLEDLRSSFSSAKDSPEDLFTPKRIISTPSQVNIVKFAFGGSRLLVGQDNGSLLVYDTTPLFSEDTNEVHPLTSAHLQTSHLRQIVPNPGTEPGLSNLVAVVSNGKVQLLNVELEPQGGWSASDLMTQPIAVSWSPKGKHIAIGLQSGDILTYSLTNKSSPHKHIPPTVDGILASLNWVGPGHTFRTSYTAASDSQPQQHIITLDTKTSTAIYFAPEHPFPISDRNYQNAYIVTFPKWDADSASNDESKSLTVVGDSCSVDLEILGNASNSWYRQSQENPLSLPLDSSMEDTILVALESDFTDASAAAPVLYAYMNDGSLQGWHLEHSKPYQGIITPGASGSFSASGQASVPTQGSGKDADMVAEESNTTNVFAQSSTTNNAFGQASSFGSQQAPAFGQTGFGRAPSAFGQSSFGQPSTFAAATGFGSTSSFGQPSQSNSSSSFGNVKSEGGFGAFGGSNSAFGSSGASAFGATPSAFGNLNSGSTNAFGQGSFGSSSQPAAQATPSSPTLTREASMSDSTPGFGGLGLGSATPSDPNARNSMFGSFGTTSNTTTNTESSGFGSGPLVKPATGFGAFGDTKPNSTFTAPKPSTPATSAFGTSSQPATNSGFGQSGFANPAFGKSGFGQTGFGQPAFGKSSFGAPATTATTTTPSSGGFGAFANATTTFGSAAQQQASTTTSTSGGFSAFASSTPSAFGTASGTTSASESKPATQGGFASFSPNSASPFAAAGADDKSKAGSGGGFSAFSSSTPLAFGTEAAPKKSPEAASPFGATASNSPSPFVAPSTPGSDAAPRASVFGVAKTPFGDSFSSRSSTSPSPATPSKPSPFAINDNGSPEHASPASSPEPSKSPPPAWGAASTTPASTPNAFSNLQTTPSAFKPASGFGAFGSFGGPSTSPFFKKPDETPPRVTAFALNSSPKSPTSVAAAPTFGSTSALGGPKSVFAPVTPTTTTPSKAPASGAFSAFSTASSAFSSYAGTKASFSDLLKTGGEETTDPVKSPAQPITPKSDEVRTPVFGTPKTPPKKSPPPISAFAPIAKDNEKEGGKGKAVSDEPSYGSISASSAASSFVDISEEVTQDEDAQSDEDAEHSGEDDDAHSFLSDNYSDSYQEEEDESAEEGSDKESLPEIPEEDERSPSPETVVAAGPSRSPSATPQPETPSIKVSLPPDDDDAEQSSESTVPEREASTTPPASPVKETSPASIPLPTTPAAGSSPSSLGIGLGRPSTRPTRSSPLANAISHDDEEEEEETVKPIAPIPVSPRAAIGILPVKLEDAESDETSIKRQKTPPLLSMLGGGKSPSPSTSSLPPVQAPVFKNPSSLGSAFPLTPLGSPGSGALDALAAVAVASAPSIFGKSSEAKVPSPPARPATAPIGLFGVPPTPTPSPSLTQPSIFRKAPLNFGSATSLPSTSGQASTAIKSPTLPTMPSPGIFGGSTPLAGPEQQPFGLFGAAQPKVPVPPLFGGSVPTTPTPKGSLPFSLTSTSTPGTPPKSLPTSPPQAVPSPEYKLEQGMQNECVNLVKSVENDLAQVAQIMGVIARIRAESGVPLGGSRFKADLGNKAKWNLADLEQFGRVLHQFEADLDVLESNREKDQQNLREIQSNMLKAGTRREEIARFNKAKDDKEFAKMLRSRNLGPEYIETQSHLRRSIKMVHDRIQKLETHLQEDKKKLAQSTSHKPSFRAPTLDTINRTYRNIEMAIEQQSDEVARLASRVGKLNIKEASESSLSRDQCHPNADSRRAYNVTPNVAATTAAALNAERTAQRLKKALLLVRSEPLLNTKAASAPSAPMAFATPQKPPGAASLFSEPPAVGTLPDWDIPPDNFNPTGSSPLSMGFRNVAKPRKHQPFKRNPTSVTASTSPFTPAGFEWGPLPDFSSKPK